MKNLNTEQQLIAEYERMNIQVERIKRAFELFKIATEPNNIAEILVKDGEDFKCWTHEKLYSIYEKTNVAPVGTLRRVYKKLAEDIRNKKFIILTKNKLDFMANYQPAAYIHTDFYLFKSAFIKALNELDREI